MGSGAGGALLSTVTAYPELRAVGVERAGDVVEELRNRAEAASVAPRVEVRHADAQHLTDEAVYPVCYWAQAFFPHGTREVTLAALRRALTPDGLLLVQELTPPPDASSPATLSATLDTLLADCRGIPPVASAESLTTELRTAGFTDVTVIPTPVGLLVVARKGG